MSHTLGKSVYFSAFLLLIVVSAYAQDVTPVSRSNRENAPYSRYGMGEERNGLNTVLKGIGTVSSAYSNPYAANTDNPASYARIKLTTYDAGGEARTKTILSSTEKYKTGMATVSYFNIAIPAGKYMGLNIGLRPEKRLYYMLDDTSVIPGYGKAVRSDRGDGSLNYGFLGVAGKYKDFALGVNFGYLFGTTDKLSYLINLDNTVETYNSLYNRSIKTGGIYWSAGALYDVKLQKERMIRLGATMTLSQDLNTSGNETWINYSTVTGYADTAFSRNTQSGKVTMPMSYGAGVQFLQSDKLVLALDYKSVQWSQFRNMGNKDSLADNAYRLALGCEYTPDALALHNYFRRVTYRIGAYYGQDKVMLNNTTLPVMAVTTGLSLPFRRSSDRLHFSAEIGTRGTTTNGLIKENFVRFGVGISLNDRWFVQRKYD